MAYWTSENYRRIEFMEQEEIAWQKEFHGIAMHFTNGMDKWSER